MSAERDEDSTGSNREAIRIAGGAAVTAFAILLTAMGASDGFGFALLVGWATLIVGLHRFGRAS